MQSQHDRNARRQAAGAADGESITRHNGKVVGRSSFKRDGPARKPRRKAGQPSRAGKDKTMSEAVAEHRAQKRAKANAKRAAAKAKREAKKAQRADKAAQRAGKAQSRRDPEAVAARKAKAAQRKADQSAKREAAKAKRKAQKAENFNAVKARSKKQAKGRKDQKAAADWKNFQAESKMLKQNEKISIDAEKKALREKLKELDAQKKAARQAATAQIKFIKQQFKDARSRLEKGRPANPNQSWSWWKRASNQSAKADPKATTMEMQQHLGGEAEGPAQMLPQHPTFDNVPVLTAGDIHMSSMDDDGEGYKLTLGDYCLLTAIALCIAYLIYKLYKACVARREANENEEAMLAQAIELSQDPQVHEVVVGGQRIVTVPVQQAGQQKIVSIQMPQTQACAVSAVQGNAMPRGTDMSQASSQAAGCPNMFGN